MSTRKAYIFRFLRLQLQKAERTNKKDPSLRLRLPCRLSSTRQHVTRQNTSPFPSTQTCPLTYSLIAFHNGHPAVHPAQDPKPSQLAAGRALEVEEDNRTAEVRVEEVGSRNQHTCHWDLHWDTQCSSGSGAASVLAG